MIHAHAVPPTGKQFPSVLTLTFQDNGFKPIPRIRLTDEEYGRALQRFIGPCADIVPIDAHRRVFYLAKRQQKPNPSWWWIGGGILPGQPIDVSATQCFKRETGIELDPARLTLAANIDYRWENRAQEPTDMGCHMIGYTFLVELTRDELAQAAQHLQPDEYETELGFEAFDRKRIIALTDRYEIHPAILAVYDHVFLPIAEPAVRRFKAQADMPDTVEFPHGVLVQRQTCPHRFHWMCQFDYDETIVILSGGGTIRLTREDSHGQPIGQPFQYNVKLGDVISIPAHYLRTMTFHPGTCFLTFSQPM